MADEEDTTEHVRNIRVQRDAEDRHVVHVNVEYPRTGPITTIEVDIECVRADDGFRATYDYERGGWSILQASVFEGPSYNAHEGPPPDFDPTYDPDWQEVAFIPSWQRQEDPNITRESEERRIRREAFNEACEAIADAVTVSTFDEIGVTVDHHRDSILEEAVTVVRDRVYTVRDKKNPHDKKNDGRAEG